MYQVFHVHQVVLLVQWVLDVQLIQEILDYPSLLLCPEIQGIPDHLSDLEDLGYLVLPGDLVGPCRLQFQVDL